MGLLVAMCFLVLIGYVIAKSSSVAISLLFAIGLLIAMGLLLEMGLLVLMAIIVAIGLLVVMGLLVCMCLLLAMCLLILMLKCGNEAGACNIWADMVKTGSQIMTCGLYAVFSAFCQHVIIPPDGLMGTASLSGMTEGIFRITATTWVFHFPACQARS